MRKLVILTVIFIGFSHFSFGQIKEINDHAQWRFVRSNDVKLITGQYHTFEFPAFRTHDYILNIEVRSDTVDVEMYIYDMQSKLIKELKTPATSSTNVEFGVRHNATYQVMVKVKSKNNGQAIKEVNTLLSLLKRPKI